jgi:transcriptional regulator with XRE-family HTH domain
VFGQFIHTQRKLAGLSLRELAARADVSNAYLSRLGRGLHATSVRVLKSGAEAFNRRVQTLLDRPARSRTRSPSDAIRTARG